MVLRSTWVTRLARGGHEVVAYDRSGGLVNHVADVGGTGVDSLDALVGRLSAPRAVWVMVPAGAPTESTVSSLADLLSPGDTIIDGGNTNFHDDVRRAATLASRGITYIDAGTSGGIWGISLRSPRVADALAPSDFVYDVVERSNDDSEPGRVRTGLRTVGSLLGVDVLARAGPRVFDRLVDPAVTVVTVRFPPVAFRK